MKEINFLSKGTPWRWHGFCVALAWFIYGIRVAFALFLRSPRVVHMWRTQGMSVAFAWCLRASFVAYAWHKAFAWYLCGFCVGPELAPGPPRRRPRRLRWNFRWFTPGASDADTGGSGVFSTSSPRRLQSEGALAPKYLPGAARSLRRKLKLFTAGVSGSGGFKYFFPRNPPPGGFAAAPEPGSVPTQVIVCCNIMSIRLAIIDWDDSAVIINVLPESIKYRLKLFQPMLADLMIMVLE